MFIREEYKVNKTAMVVSSCFARQCHPETCCCDDDEYAIQQEVQTINHLGMYCGYHWTTIAWGTRKELEDHLEKNRKS